MHFTQTEAPMELYDELATSPFVTYLDDVQLSEQLTSGAIKKAAVVACSDMGCILPFVHGAPEASLLIFQDFGHRTSRQELVDLLSGDSISDLIVYGHCDCEFASFLSAPKVGNDLGSELDPIAIAVLPDPQIHQCGAQPADHENYSEVKASRCRVLNELKSVLLCPSVLRRAETQHLRLHGWLANTDGLEVFDPASKGFVRADRNSRMENAAKVLS